MDAEGVFAWCSFYVGKLELRLAIRGHEFFRPLLLMYAQLLQNLADVNFQWLLANASFHR